MNDKGGKLSVTEKIGYGFGDLASNMFWQMFSIFIAKFYTDVFLLGAATMGTMLLVTRMFDSVLDPMMGTLADRTETRWGKFRPYLLWMALPMALTAVATFTTPSFGGTARIVYAYLTLSLMMLAYTAINIPYSALLGVLTPDSKERTSASSYRFVMALLPVFIIVNTAIPMVEWFGGGNANSPAGWQMTMVIYSAAAVLMFWATFALTRERVKPPAEQQTSLKEDLRNLLRNRPWVVLSAVGIAALTYANIRGTVSIYYFEYTVPNGKALFGPIMTTGAAAFIAGVMLTSPLSRRFGKRNFYMVSMALTALLTCAFYFVPTDNVPLVWGANALINFVAAPTAPLVWAMYADSADYSEWKFGRRATGLVFSAASFAQKLGWAIGGAGTGWLLAWFGYVPNVAQSPETLNGLKLMMSFIPAAGAVLAIIALWFYPLDEPTVERISGELEARRSGEGSAPSAAPAAPAPLHAAPAKPSPPLSAAERAALQARQQQWLQRGVHGLCFSPYAEGQQPGAPLDAAQIRARLEILRPHTRWVRTFSCTQGHEQVPAIARLLGLKTLVGAWLGRDRAANRREIDALIALARAGQADIVAVGNEVLLRGDLGEDELLAHLAQVREALPGVPAGCVEAGFMLERHPRVAAAGDALLCNSYPFWEGSPREQALALLQAQWQRLRALAAGRPVIVTETGWPGQGNAFRGALPSPEAAVRYFVDVQQWAADEGVPLFWFEAFDEAWKRGSEGEVGAHWGLWDAQGRLKTL